MMISYVQMLLHFMLNMQSNRAMLVHRSTDVKHKIYCLEVTSVECGIIKFWVCWVVRSILTCTEGRLLALDKNK